MGLAAVEIGGKSLNADIPDSLEGIELTEEGKGPQEEIVFIKDPERAAELDDSARLSILRVLREGIPDTVTSKRRDEKTGDLIIRQREIQRHALSVVEIVKQSKKVEGAEEVTKNQVYHHLPKLIDANYVVKYGTVTTGKRTTDYYRRTAKGFVVTTGMLDADEKVLKKKSRNYVEKITQKFDIELTEEQQKELANLLLQKYKLEMQPRREVANLIRGDLADKELLDLYEFLIEIQSLGQEAYIDLHRRMREIIFSNN
ncbi:hypothetical protein EU537_07640 [Candidatus Thorarchaeota archaeon]|nr:MAG: hypothetical protein EU537_07640 [Candidatus Thorarchaeota archaeon]